MHVNEVFVPKFYWFDNIISRQANIKTIITVLHDKLYTEICNLSDTIATYMYVGRMHTYPKPYLLL